MRIETAHKILIGSAIGFFALYSLFELTRWRGSGGGAALLRAVGGLTASAVFALYLRSYLRGLRRSTGGFR